MMQRTELNRAVELLHERPDLKTVEHALQIIRNGQGTQAEPKSNHKYGAQRTEVDGITFDSKAESEQYVDLKHLEAAGLIVNLELQPRFDLTVQGVKIGQYVADFRYVDVETNEVVVEDVKGVKTPMYRWKKRHLKAQYGIDVKEVTR